MERVGRHRSRTSKEELFELVDVGATVELHGDRPPIVAQMLAVLTEPRPQGAVGRHPSNRSLRSRLCSGEEARQSWSALVGTEAELRRKSCSSWWTWAQRSSCTATVHRSWRRCWRSLQSRDHRERLGDTRRTAPSGHGSVAARRRDSHGARWSVQKQNFEGRAVRAGGRGRNGRVARRPSTDRGADVGGPYRAATTGSGWATPVEPLPPVTAL